VDNSTYRKHKAALTRAVNSKDPVKVLAAVEKAYVDFDGGYWPDDWHRWNMAAYDAHRVYLRGDDPDDAVLERFRRVEAKG
jgi:hypothetical protein